MIQNIPSLNTNASTAEEMFENFQPSLILIDYGVSIDMSQFPKGTTFTHKFKKNKHYTVEMMESKPWTWQVDYFGLANITHSLLYGNYMTVKKVGTKYEPNGTPKRWMYAQLWNDFFFF
jgi:checkpoint serine/threonine-protein kinase